MLTNAYGTLADLKDELGIPTATTTFDPKLERAHNAASRQVDKHCNRRFWQDSVVVAREFYADDEQVCYVDDISTVTGLIVKVDTADNGFVSGTTTHTIVTDFVLHPRNAALEVPAWPYTRIMATSNAAFPVSCSGRPGVQVTAKFGWPAVPDDVAKACITQAAQLFKASDAVFGAVQMGDGFAMRLRSSLNPLAEALLEGYVKQA